MLKINIDPTFCEKDGLCARVCPMGVLVQNGPRTAPTIMHTELCITCGHCLAICPQGALTHSALPREIIQPVLRERLPTPETLMHFFNARRSIRAFKNAPITPDLITQIIAAARYAPNAHNARSTEYVVVQEPATLDRMVQWTAQYFKTLAVCLGNPVLRPPLAWLLRNKHENFELLAEEFKVLAKTSAAGQDPILHRAPAVIIFHARQTAPFAAANANLAAQNAALMAQALGLGAFYLGYVVNACEIDHRIPRLLGLPKKHRIYAGLALGHPAVRFTHWIEKGAPQIRWL